MLGVVKPRKGPAPFLVMQLSCQPTWTHLAPYRLVRETMRIIIISVPGSWVFWNKYLEASYIIFFLTKWCKQYLLVGCLVVWKKRENKMSNIKPCKSYYKTSISKSPLVKMCSPCSRVLWRFYDSTGLRTVCPATISLMNIWELKAMGAVSLGLVWEA